MNVYEIAAVFECINCSLCLALEIGIDIACCTLNLGHKHTCTDADTLEQVNGGNDTALHTELLFEILKLRFCALTPEPD